MVATLMLSETYPTVEVLERNAKFLGYNQYCPVYRWEKANWEIVDLLKPDGTTYKYVEKYRRRLGELVSGYNPFTGGPQ